MNPSLRALLTVAIITAFAGAGCVHTWGAPEGLDDYDAESNAEAMEEEEVDDAWRDSNR